MTLTLCFALYSRVEDIAEAGKNVAIEGGLMSHGLSFLLSGRLVVKANNSVLHKIEVHQLLQSIEWTAVGQDPRHSHTWQVTIEAEEVPLTILHLDTAVIERMTEARPDLKLTIECLVAKDVSVKMYMVNKMMRDTEITNTKRKEKKLDKCHKSSSSLDAINTGWKGLMRSYFWCEYGREGSGRSGNKQNENFQQNISIPNHFTHSKLEENTHLFWPNKGQNINQI